MNLYSRDWEHPSSHRRGVLTDDNDALAGELCVKVDMLRELSKSIGDETDSSPQQPEGQGTSLAGALKLLLPFLLFILLLDSISDWKIDKKNHGLMLELSSYKERLPIDHAQFYVLYEPSSLEIRATPQGKDVDLYLIANDDLDYFRHRIPQLEKFINSSPSSFSPASKTTRLVKLDPPVPWEIISPPEEVKSIHRLINATITTYWSSIPTFTLASTSLGVERLYVPAAFRRPLFVVVFAPPSGVVETDDSAESPSLKERQYHHYVIQLLEETDEVVSTYEAVRAAAERQSFSYSELAAMFSTLHVESQREMRTRSSLAGTATPQDSRVQRNKVVKRSQNSRAHFEIGVCGCGVHTIAASALAMLVQIITFVVLFHGIFSLHEDQIGKFDWRQQYIGNTEYYVIGHLGAKDFFLYLASESHVLGALNAQNGSLGCYFYAY
ncbi:hypothetical protein TcWFU_008500 [Taenia crassiceps]|uniref:EMC1 first beta-propeller domain-containing protein n=1 Tax=Taenia crassiceps TaxID=6207 RepID=A0ABR4Q7C9_9CEST